MINIIQIPTSIRFKKSKDAKYFYTDTKTWHPIETLKNNGDGYFHISTNEFAWVSFNIKTVEKELEFKYNEVHPMKVFDDEYYDEEEDYDDDEN